MAAPLRPDPPALPPAQPRTEAPHTPSAGSGFGCPAAASLEIVMLKYGKRVAVFVFAVN